MEPQSSSGDQDELPPPRPLDPDATTSSGIRRLLQPPLWQRFQQHLDDPSNTPAATGAHVTLSDLEKLAELREAASSAYSSVEPAPQPGPDGKLSGWVGTPDPSKYAPGTNTLNDAEIEEEVAKGNIVMLDDWVGEISNLELWEKKALFETVLKDWMQHRLFVKTENGRKVSFWDLYRYVHFNPELKALVESRRNGIASTGSAESSGSQQQDRIAPGLYENPGNEHWAELDLETARQLPWGLVGTGQVWSRRPTRWLWGADAQLDVGFAMYVHEDDAHKILGPKYAHQDPRIVLSDENYVKDIMRAGPLMGMTFMLTAARELPVQETSKAWISRLAARLHSRAQQQPVPGPLPEASDSAAVATSSSNSDRIGLPVDELAGTSPQFQKSMEALFGVYCMLDPERLAENTKLLDLEGRHFRTGSSLMASTGPGGKVVLQATSPGLAREREGYLLGAVEDEELAAALVEEFLGEDPVDPEFAANAPTGMLMFANGFKTDNTDQNPLMKREEDGPGFKAEVIPAKPSVFRLPRVGAQPDSDECQPLLLSGVRERAMVGALSDVYQRAWKAATDLQPSSSGKQTADAEMALYRQRQEAARAVLEQGLSTLGLIVQGLSFEEMQGEVEPFTADEKAVLAAVALPSKDEGKRNLRRAKMQLSGAR